MPTTNPDIAPTGEAAVVLFSGGQDSTTCLFWALEKFAEVTALLVAYGQRHAVELQQARRIAAAAGVRLVEVATDFFRLHPDNALTNPELAVLDAPESGGLPNTFVPGRNLVFLNIAAIHAYGVGARRLVAGVCQTDYSGYPDCRLDFVESAEQTLSLAMAREFMIHAPLMFLDKAETWRLAERLGRLETVVELSHTCYNGDRTRRHAWGYGCGTCPACKLRRAGYEKAFGR